MRTGAFKLLKWHTKKHHESAYIILVCNIYVGGPHDTFILWTNHSFHWFVHVFQWISSKTD